MHNRTAAISVFVSGRCVSSPPSFPSVSFYSYVRTVVCIVPHGCDDLPFEMPKSCFVCR